MIDGTWLRVDSTLVENQMNESRVIAVVAGRELPMTEEAHAPMMSFGGTPLSDDCSCSPINPTSGANMPNVRLQEANKATQRHQENPPPRIRDN